MKRMLDEHEELAETILQTRTKLYAYLKVNKITQIEGAEMLGISRQHLNRVLNGATLPSLPLLQRMINLIEKDK